MGLFGSGEFLNSTTVQISIVNHIGAFTTASQRIPRDVIRLVTKDNRDADYLDNHWSCDGACL
jgi:hypothetical protein